jgi:hypothetical protein
VETSAIIHDKEPGTTFLQRAMVTVLSRLPIEWLLQGSGLPGASAAHRISTGIAASRS